MSDQQVFGAYAFVQIRFNGSLLALAQKVSAAFNISGFNVEPSEYPPYNEIGSAEALGWELSLKAAEQSAGSFELRLETEHAVQESFHGQMHDLSPWLARFLGMMCDLDVTPVAPHLPPSTPRG
jgi:hypothetical protein